MISTVGTAIRAHSAIPPCSGIFPGNDQLVFEIIVAFVLRSMKMGAGNRLDGDEWDQYCLCNDWHGSHL